MHVSFRAKRVHFCRAHEKAVLSLALGATDLVVDLDVSFLVDLEHVASEFLFHFRVFHPLDLEQVECVFHG